MEATRLAKSLPDVSLAVTHGRLALWMQAGLVEGGEQSASTPFYLALLR
jgi:hypothetical protein